MYGFENFDEELEYVLQLLNAHEHAITEQAQNKIVDLISDWFDENAVYVGQLDQNLYKEINRILDDGVITDEEHDTLTAYIKAYLRSHKKIDYEEYKTAKQRLSRTEIAAIVPNEELDKDFIGKVCVLTGDFERYKGKRKEAEAEIRRRGGKTSQSISGVTNMLICGGSGVGWAKIKQVKERNKQGQNIRLVDEETFYKMLENNEAVEG